MNDCDGWEIVYEPPGKIFFWRSLSSKRYATPPLSWTFQIDDDSRPSGSMMLHPKSMTPSKLLPKRRTVQFDSIRGQGEKESCLLFIPRDRQVIR
jgi:hypothetical protein